MRCAIPPLWRPPRGRPVSRRRFGFSLMETALATVIVGVGVMSVVELLAKGTTANYTAADTTTAVNLAKNIREFSLKLAFLDPNTPGTWGLDGSETASNPSGFNDINDLDGQTFSPPIDSRGSFLNTMSGWSQSVVVHSVDPNSITTDVPNGTAQACRITVTVKHNGQTVTTMTFFSYYVGTPG